MSAVCELFGCPPSVAVEQDWGLVEAIADYRAARAARDAMNDPDRKRGFATLRDSPGLLRALAYMARAQQGKPLDAPQRELAQEGIDVAAVHRDAPEVEEED